MSYVAISASDVANATPEMFAAVALGALQNNLVMARRVNRDFDPKEAERGDVISITKRGALTVKDKAEDTDHDPQEPANTKVSITLNKHKYIDWILSSRAKAKAIADAVNYVEDAGKGLAQTIDNDLTGLYTLAGANVGTYGTLATPSLITAARRALATLKCPNDGPQNRSFVVDEHNEENLLNQNLFVSVEQAGDKTALESAELGNKYGFKVLMDQNIRETAGTPTQRHCMAFHRDAFVLATRLLELPDAGKGVQASVMNLDGIGLRIINGWSMDAGGNRWVIDVLYGVGSMRASTHSILVKA